MLAGLQRSRVEHLVNLNYLFARLVAIHDRHVQVQNDCVVVLGSHDTLALLGFTLGRSIFEVEKLEHIFLNCANSLVAINGRHNFNILFALLYDLLQDNELEWLVIDQEQLKFISLSNHCWSEYRADGVRTKHIQVIVVHLRYQIST